MASPARISNHGGHIEKRNNGHVENHHGGHIENHHGGYIENHHGGHIKNHHGSHQNIQHGGHLDIQHGGYPPSWPLRKGDEYGYGSPQQCKTVKSGYKISADCTHRIFYQIKSTN